MISVLIPTRDRLEYLRMAVQSLLSQDFADWQLVVSDNCSGDGTGDYVTGLNDPRIVYHRTARLLPVTENWNCALAHSDGDYVIMLGDDDALLPGYLRRMDDLIREFSRPDVIYTRALLFTYPGVDPARPDGFLMEHGCAPFFADSEGPFVLDHARAVELVRGTMDFRLRFDFNAQFALIGRPLIESLGGYGDFYQSDFPDYYSMNAAFLRADRIVVEPTPRVVIGVTPKSYGYFHTNHLEADGKAFLEGEPQAATVGSNINVGWLSAAKTLERGIGREFGLHVSHQRYRFMQATHIYAARRKGVADKAEVRQVEQQLPMFELLLYRCLSACVRMFHLLLPGRLKKALGTMVYRMIGQLPAVDYRVIDGRYENALEVCADWEGELRSAWAPAGARQ